MATAHWENRGIDYTPGRETCRSSMKKPRFGGAFRYSAVAFPVSVPVSVIVVAVSVPASTVMVMVVIEVVDDAAAAAG